MINILESTVLVVDDEASNIDLLVNTLKPSYKVIAVTNGLSALKVSKDEQPDLILLDVQMPDLDGYEVISQLKENPETANIPVIFATSKSNVEDQEKGFRLGAVDYITKPFSPPIVKARVKTQLELHQLISMLSAQLSQ